MVALLLSSCVTYYSVTECVLLYVVALMVGYQVIINRKHLNVIASA